MLRIINENGSAIYLLNWLNPSEGNDYFLRLEKELTWKQEKILLYGKKMLCPRLTAWYGDAEIEYKYSKVVHATAGWQPVLWQIKQRLEKQLEAHFNWVLCNLYRNGNDSMGWHADNETVLGENPVIASVSLGCPRKFQFKHRVNKKIINLVLEPGSLLIMSGELQNYWLHRLPKQAQSLAPRINLTFRKIIAG